MLLQLIINGIITGSVYALVALGYALVYNTTHIFHIAYAALYVVAAYGIFTGYQMLHLPFSVSFLLSIVLTAGFSVGIEIWVYRPLGALKASMNTMLVSSIGVMLVLINIVAIVYGNQTQVLTREISATLMIRDIILTHTQLWQFFSSVGCMALFMIFLRYNPLGIQARALRDDPELYVVLGRDVQHIRRVLFALSGVFAAVGSGWMACDTGMTPQMGMPMLLNAVVALVIGGMGRFEAAVLGGFAIGILQAGVVWAFSPHWKEAITFILLILFLVFRPQGIMGEKQRRV